MLITDGNQELRRPGYREVLFRRSCSKTCRLGRSREGRRKKAGLAGLRQSVEGSGLSSGKPAGGFEGKFLGFSQHPDKRSMESGLQAS